MKRNQFLQLIKALAIYSGGFEGGAGGYSLYLSLAWVDHNKYWINRKTINKWMNKNNKFVAFNLQTVRVC